MSIHSELLPMRGRLSYQLEDLLRRNGMSAQLAVEDGKYKLLVQGHDSPLLQYNISEQQFRALGDGRTNYANKKAYNVFNGIVGKDFDLPSSFVAARNVNGRVAMGLHGYRVGVGGLCLSVPMPLVLDSLDGCRDNSPVSIFVVSAMCLWSWSILTDAYAQES